MNFEQERAAFEAWYRYHHGDRDVYALDESGEYADKWVQGAFNVWQARAALQSQDREDAERWRYWKRWWMNSGESGQYPPEVDDVWHRNPDFDFDEAIDHARRTEGDGE